MRTRAGGVMPARCRALAASRVTARGVALLMPEVPRGAAAAGRPLPVAGVSAGAGGAEALPSWSGPWAAGLPVGSRLN